MHACVPTLRRPTYPLASAETQLRRLGDLALFLGDVKFAQSIYDTVRKDYQHDKAMRHLAGINEALAFCAALLSDTPARDAEPMAEVAASLYNRQRMSAWATRAVLLTTEAYVARGFYREIPALLLRVVSDVRPNVRAGGEPLAMPWAERSLAQPVRVHAHVTRQESDLRSAAMLEMAGYAYLRTTPTMVRKHALHLILAGQRYNKAGQVRQRRVDSRVRGHGPNAYPPRQFGLPSGAARPRAPLLHHRGARVRPARLGPGGGAHQLYARAAVVPSWPVGASAALLCAAAQRQQPPVRHAADGVHPGDGVHLQGTATTGRVQRPARSVA